MLLGVQVGSSRAKDNAQRALEMLSTHGAGVRRSTGTPKPIPPTSPVEHDYGKKRGRSKSKKGENIVVDTTQPARVPVYEQVDGED